MALKKLTFKYKLKPFDRKQKFKKGEEPPKFPLIPIRINGMNFEGLLDSGATQLLIPKEIADGMGLKLGSIYAGYGAGGEFQYHVTEVNLIIGSGANATDLGKVPAAVPVAENKFIPILIGRIPIWDFYQVIFEEFNQRLFLVPRDKAKKP